jgi:hypothetical protein
VGKDRPLGEAELMMGITKKNVIGLFFTIFIYTGLVSWLIIRDITIPVEFVGTTILFILASATIFYAFRTSDIAKATKEQAEASTKMAKQLVKPRVIPDLHIMGGFLEERRIKLLTMVNNDGNGPCFDVGIYIQNDADPPSILASFGDIISVLRGNNYKEWVNPPAELSFPHSDEVQRHYLPINYRDIDGEYEIRLPFVLATKEEDKPYAQLGSVSRKMIRKINSEDELP